MMDVEKLIKGIQEDIVNDIGEDRFIEDANKIDEVLNEIAPIILPLNQAVFATVFTMMIELWCKPNNIDPVEFMDDMTKKMSIAKIMVGMVRNAIEKGESK